MSITSRMLSGLIDKRMLTAESTDSNFQDGSGWGGNPTLSLTNN